jgi:hypothetical protein
VSLRRLRLSDGAWEETNPPVALATDGSSVFISASRDRLTVAVHDSEVKGDVWVARRSPDER